MKKKMIALLAGVLLTLGASNAMAYFDDYELVRVVYNSSTGVEYGTDLGNVKTLLSQGTTTVGGGADAFSTVAGLTSAQDANLRVAYVAMDYSLGSSTNVWLSSTAATQANDAAQYSSLQSSGQGTFLFNFGSLATSTSYQTNFQTDMNSFVNYFDATPGNMNNFLATQDGEASLATMASASVSQNLFFWANGDVNGQGVLAATILTNANGSTTITPTATPIPAAAYLLGSGLLGLFGIRRKQK